MKNKSFLKITFNDKTKEFPKGNFLVVSDDKTGKLDYYLSKSLEIDNEYLGKLNIRDKKIMEIKTTNYETAELLVTMMMNNNATLKKYSFKIT